MRHLLRSPGRIVASPLAPSWEETSIDQPGTAVEASIGSIETESPIPAIELTGTDHCHLLSRNRPFRTGAPDH